MTAEPDNRRIGGIELEKTRSQIRYVQKLYVRESELADVLPEIGDRAEWAPEEAVIAAVRKTWLKPDAWLVQLTAEVLDDSAGSLGAWLRGDADNYVNRTFSTGEVYFPPEWFGIRTAGVADAPFPGDGGVLEEGETGYLNIDGVRAAAGDYVYRNAVPRRCGADGTVIQREGVGTQDTARSPFRNDETIPAAWIGQQIRTRIYVCEYTVKRDAARVNAFAGVSGNFGYGCTPGVNQDGRWKALDQVVRTVRTARGKIYARVTRSMIEAPGTLHWDTAKNGGVWTW